MVPPRGKSQSFLKRTSDEPSVKKGDARLRIIANSRAKITDARSKIGQRAKITDARAKIETRKNTVQGRPSFKTTRRGGITISHTTKGQMVLSTKKSPKIMRQQNRRDLDDVAQKLALVLARSNVLTGSEIRRKQTKLASPAFRPTVGASRIKRSMGSEADRLDDELMRSHVPPELLRRTIRQDIRPLASREPLFTRRASPERMNYQSYVRERQTSELAGTSAPRRGIYDYDDPRRDIIMEDEMYRRRIMQNQPDSFPVRTFADKYSDNSVSHVSPLQGTKVLVHNLEPTVTAADIGELFGGVGAIKRFKKTGEDSFEVVFVKREDALRAVESYHNRSLDGRPMKCVISTPELPQTETRFSGPARTAPSNRESLHPTLSVVHKALFSNSAPSASSSRLFK